MTLKTTLNHWALLNRLFFNTCIFTFIILCNYNGFSQTTYNITSPSQLTAAFSLTLAPGDTVIFADGTYTASATMRFNGVGTAANPITLKAATPGGVKFTNGQTLKIGGEYCIIDGFHWKGGNGASNFIEFRDSSNYANNSILQNCVVDGLLGTSTSTASIKHNWVVLYGTYNTVINCSFLNKMTSGNMILAEYQFNASPDGTGTPNTRCDVVGHTISNNYFYNYSKIDSNLTNSGDSETIRIGTSEYQNVNSNAMVSNNYFVQADGENEIITNKSKGNSYINNTFRRCRGSLVLRHGSHTTVDGNYFLGEDVDGTGGIRIVDSYQTVTNNYIQDCITVGDNAIWNNGITFLGGNDSSAVVCTSTSMSNGYQKVTDLNLSNNTIVNTNAPLFFNINTGTTKPLGTVSNNLIYFVDSDPNTTAVITGNTTSPIPMGTALTYAANIYKGTTLGETTYPGFSLEAGITATQSGEIYTLTGTSGKGANMNSYTPTTDAMVGHAIGACFVDNLGANITNGDCTIVIPETLVVGTVPDFTNLAGSQNASVTANVSWTALSNDSWITITPTSGTGDATVSVTVTENTGTESRTGTVTFSQNPGGDNIVRTLNISQDAPAPPDPRDGLNLINKTAADAAVSYVSNEEVNSTKFNYAVNSLDKDFNTQWAGNGALDPGGSNNAIIIYDLKGAFDLELVDIATTSGKTYNLQIWVSSTGTADTDFSNPFPAGDLASNSDASFKSFVLPSAAIGTKYVKIIGNGQVGSTSRFTTLHEVEFYSTSNSLSIDDKGLANQIIMFPNPAKDFITLKNIRNNVSLIQVFSLDGRKVLEKAVKSSESEIKLDVSSISNGAYLLNTSNAGVTKQSKMIIVSH
ncbi:chondroitinase-B domain-containing protein [Mariniflexile sp. AS56]|uniref:chondroitinase-B domain-containing protein n=1 Tax=Mariniflexile sp. AS56 TaxID=3063957 RepID=UPI0026ED163B|nr:chondroitinase-B domain-containing protein [Mariniflexile sp. AS56]MDO7173927.1 chondroitinase-B domain-containing protein [Mariniflexile sp. AS56]